MESFFREIAIVNEAWDVEHNVPCKRQFTHDELQPAIKAIREIEAAKLKMSTSAVIDAIVLDALK